MMTLYARREPTTDDVIWKHDPQAARLKRDVVLYRDPEATRPAGRYPWHRRGRPNKRSRTVTVNCYRWRLEWLPDKARPVEAHRYTLGRRLYVRLWEYHGQARPFHVAGFDMSPEASPLGSEIFHHRFESEADARAIYSRAEVEAVAGRLRAA